MVYFVKTITSNGYRCHCCHNSWETTKQVADLTEALSLVPKKHSREPESELEQVVVTDGATGKEVARGQLEHLGARHIRYSHYRWYGFRDGKPFEELHGLRDGESIWDQIVERVNREADQAKLKQLESEANAKLKEIELLKARMK